MRNFKIYLLGVAAMLFSTSCLDKDPTHAILADQSITTVEEANQAVMGIYSDFMSRYLYSGNLTLLPDIQSDLVYAVMATPILMEISGAGTSILPMQILKQFTVHFTK